MLDAIAAVFLGMALTSNGEARVPATVAGVIILGLIDNALTQLSIDSYVRQIMIGAIVLIAVGITSMRSKQS